MLTLEQKYVIVNVQKQVNNIEGEKDMIRKIDGNVYVTEFTTITELVQFIKTNKPNKVLKKYSFEDDCEIFDSDKKSEHFIKNTKTKDYAEAEDLLLHGWEHGVREIKNKVEAKETGMSLKQKSVYDVVGFQASVPRYLQGIPNNMVNKTNIKQKNKVITINKCATYNWGTHPKVIIEESVKVLQLINRLEKQGYRVNLNVIFATSRRNITVTKIRIKSSSQRLNIKQVAFPLCHPSMLRRIIFAVWERQEENNYESFKKGYGYVVEYWNLKGYVNKGEYLIPALLDEKEIIEIDKYKIN